MVNKNENIMSNMTRKEIFNATDSFMKEHEQLEQKLIPAAL
jgi:hypothetical protein